MEQFDDKFYKAYLEKGDKKDILKFMNNILDDFDDGIHNKIQKIKYQLFVHTEGYPGSKKIVKLDTEKTDEKIRELLNKFQKDVNDELQKLTEYITSKE